jgi:putative transcriptional regulator
MSFLAGHFLAAAPQLQDPNFSRSVVLMLQHEQQGALGVIINRPGDKTVADVWKMIGADACDCQQVVHLGGPVPGPMIAIHNDEECAEREIISGVYMSMQRDAIDQLVRHTTGKFLLFSGHAGWSGGQLEAEMKVGGWLTTKADAREIFAEPESIWRTVCNRIGREILLPHIPPEQIPKDPGLN